MSAIPLKSKFARGLKRAPTRHMQCDNTCPIAPRRAVDATTLVFIDVQKPHRGPHCIARKLNAEQLSGIRECCFDPRHCPGIAAPPLAPSVATADRTHVDDGSTKGYRSNTGLRLTILMNKRDFFVWGDPS
jgi:hypothetical protein